MAEVTPTNRVVSSHGNLKVETGQFVYDTGAVSFKTKLGHILFLKIAGSDVSDNTGIQYWNSTTTVQDNGEGGWVYVLTGLADGTYNYTAYGWG